MAGELVKAYDTQLTLNTDNSEVANLVRKEFGISLSYFIQSGFVHTMNGERKDYYESLAGKIENYLEQLREEGKYEL